MITASILHIAFTTDGARRLREALRLAGRDDRVTALADDLTIGPINPANPTLRRRWLDTEIGHPAFFLAGGDTRLFWRRVATHRGRRVAWTSRRSAWGYAGLLELNRRLGETPFDVVDLTDMPVTISNREVVPIPAVQANRLLTLGTADILDSRLWDLATTALPAQRSAWSAVREHLREDRAMLRIVDADLILRSAPLSHFDEMLLSRVLPRWSKCARIIGQIMRSLDKHPCPHQVADYFLASRLRALVSAGRIEGVGDLRRIRFSEVRSIGSVWRGVNGSRIQPLSTACTTIGQPSSLPGDDADPRIGVEIRRRSDSGRLESHVTTEKRRGDLGAQAVVVDSGVGFRDIVRVAEDRQCIG